MEESNLISFQQKMFTNLTNIDIAQNITLFSPKVLSITKCKRLQYFLQILNAHLPV